MQKIANKSEEELLLLAKAEKIQESATAVVKENEQAYKERITAKQIETFDKLTPVGQAVWQQLVAVENGAMPKGAIINSNISQNFTRFPGGLSDEDINIIKEGYYQKLVGHTHKYNKKGKIEATANWTANEVNAKLAEYKEQVKLPSNLYSETIANFSEVKLDRNSKGEENVASSVVLGKLKESITLRFKQITDEAKKEGIPVTLSMINGATLPSGTYTEIINSLTENPENWKITKISDSDMKTIEKIVDKLPGNKADRENFISKLKELNARLDPNLTASEEAFSRQSAALIRENKNFAVEGGISSDSSFEIKGAKVLGRTETQVNSFQGSVKSVGGGGIDANALYASQNKVGIGNVTFFGGVGYNSAGAMTTVSDSTYINDTLSSTKVTETTHGAAYAAVGAKIETNPFIGNDRTGVKAYGKVVGALSTDFQTTGVSLNGSVGLDAYARVAKDLNIGVKVDVGTEGQSVAGLVRFGL